MSGISKPLMHKDTSWSELYSFRAKLASLIRLYIKEEDLAIREDVTNRVVELIHSYEAHITDISFLIRRKTWKDIYPSFFGRVRARIGFFFWKKPLLKRFRWYHLLFGYKVWVNLNMNGLNMTDILCLTEHKQELADEGADIEALLVGIVESSLKYEPIAILKTPNGEVICDTHCIFDDEEEININIPLIIGP